MGMRRLGLLLTSVAVGLAAAGCGSSASTHATASTSTLTIPATVSTVVPTATQSQTRTVAAAAGSIYWGARVGTPTGDVLAPWSRPAIIDFSHKLGRSPSVLHFEAPFATCTAQSCTPLVFPETAMDNIRSTGGIPMLSLGSDSIPLSPGEAAYSLRKVADGDFDSYLRQFAGAAAAWGHPLFLRFDWDMNQSWAPWGAGNNGNTPAEFVAAWRHVHDVFTSAGARNVTWVWCPSAQPSAKGAPVAAYYPGSAYVDWTCLTGITQPNQQYTGGFASLFGSSYAQLTKLAPSKPVMIGEVGTYLTGGAMAAWVSNMFATIPTRFPAIRAVVWADIDDPGSGTPLEKYPAVVSAFSSGVRAAPYATNVFGHLSTSPIPPPA